MKAKTDRIIKDLYSAIRQSDKKGTSGYDTPAEVTRIEGDTAWVHIPGGVDETPVKMTIGAKKGDTVQVRVSGGSAWLIGNASAPPTDDTKANQIGDTVIVTQKLLANTIEANEARFNSVEADTAKIHHLEADEIQATVAYIDDLTANNITAEDITADHATVDNLDATYATIQSLNAESARITNLQATKADITDLNAEKARIDTLEANEAVINDTLTATNAHVEYLESDWISTDRLVLTGNNKNNYPPVEITESEFNVNKTAYYTKSGDTYTQCTSSSVYNADTQYYVKQTVQSIIEAINTANNTDPQVVVSNDKLIAASMDVAELSAITANMGTLTAGKIQKGNNFINLNTSPASMEFKNASTWANATQGLQFDTQGNLNIKGTINVTSGNVYTKTETEGLIDDIEVGGRNLLKNSMLIKSGGNYGVTLASSSNGDEYVYISGTATSSGSITIGDLTSLTSITNATVTISVNYVFSNTANYFGVSTTKDGAYYKAYSPIKYYSPTERRLTITLENGETLRYLYVYVASGSTLSGSYRFKVELGNKQTDWTPAPEDVERDIDDARKTATSYLTTISGTSGISVHDANNTSNYVNINSSAVNVVQGGTNVAQFGANTRIGAIANSQSRVLIQPSGIDFISRNDSGTDANLAHIGYGPTYSLGVEGTDSYFTFGARGSGIIGAKSACMGEANVAGGLYGVALGSSNTVMGSFGIALGTNNEAKAYKSNTLGVGLRAYGSTQTVLGAYNIADGDGDSSLDKKGNYVLIVGNGTSSSSSARSNALTVDWSGNVNIASGAKYKINGTNLSASDVGAVRNSYGALTNVFPQGFTNADSIKVGITGSVKATPTATEDTQYLFGARATAPVLFNDSTNTTIWTGYTNLNPPTASDVGALPKSGGTLTGGLTLSAGNTISVYTGKSSSAGGWANHRFRFLDADGTAYAWIGAYGNGDAFSYMYLGANAYNGNNLRVYDDGHIWANGIVNNGTYNALYKITEATVSVPAGSAGNISSASYSMTAQSGYKAVGVVGISLGSFNVRPLSYYIESDTSIKAGFTRVATTSQAYNVVFKILWLKATSA